MIARDDRGIAAPVAVLALLIAVELSLALSALSAPEIAIGNNHILGVQARQAAESGLETVRVALSNPHALPARFPSVLAESPLVRIPGTSAGYRAAVSIDPGWTAFEQANQRRVTVTGMAAAGDLETAEGRAVRTLEAVLRRESLLSTFFVPAAAVLAGGASLRAEIDARRASSPDVDPWCLRPGEALTPLAGAAAGSGQPLHNAGLVWGPSGVPNEPGAALLHRDAPDYLFANFAFLPEELAALRALAISTGTLYRGNPVVFAAHAPLPAPGTVVYVEGDLEIEAYGAETRWTGWLLAVSPAGPGSGGRIAFRCLPGCAPGWARLTIDGLLYAEDRLDVDTAGANRALILNGAAIAHNRGGAPSRVEPERAADVRINLRCQGDRHARPGVRDAIAGTPDTIGVFDPSGRAGWFVKPGGYREVAGQP